MKYLKWSLWLCVFFFFCAWQFHTLLVLKSQIQKTQQHIDLLKQDQSSLPNLLKQNQTLLNQLRSYSFLPKDFVLRQHKIFAIAKAISLQIARKKPPYFEVRGPLSSVFIFTLHLMHWSVAIQSLTCEIKGEEAICQFRV